MQVDNIEGGAPKTLAFSCITLCIATTSTTPRCAISLVVTIHNLEN